MRTVVLSKRLQAVASMVTAGNSVCDVGCDHGFVPIWLVERGISPKVLAMDVRSGPLSAAREHIAEYGLESCIETRLSDGLHNYNIGEADTLICAGMGGKLMMRILSEDKAKTESFREMVLQPQSEIEQFRVGLREMGYQIADEKMIEEDGKFYPMMRIGVTLCKPRATFHVSRSSANYVDMAVAWKDDIVLGDITDENMLCKLKDRYGFLLLQRKDCTLAKYLRREERIYGEILTKLRAEGLSDIKREHRYTEVSKLRDECRMAMRIVEDDRR